MHDASARLTDPLRAPGSGLVDRPGVSETAVDVAIVSAAALALGLTRLGKPSLWLDEAFTARAIDYPFPDILLQFHWLFYLLEKPWTSLAGTSEWALRAPAVVAAMLASALLVILARRMFDRRVALLSGLLLATNPFVVKWSQQARSYTLLVAASLLAALLILRALDRGTRGAWVGYGLSLSLVLMIHPVAGVALLPAHVVLLAQRRRYLQSHSLIGAFPVVVLGFAWAGTVAVYTTGDNSTNPLTFPSGDVVARTLAEISGIVGVGVVLAVLGLWALRRAGQSDIAVWLAVWAFGPFVVVLGGSVLKAMFLDRYLIVTAPAFALLGAVALSNLAPRLRPVVAPILVALIALGLVHWYQQGDDGGNWHGENWAGAIQTVYTERGHRGPLLVIPYFAHAAPRYYRTPWRSIAPNSDSVWALRWSEDRDPLTDDDRQALGLGGHRLAETLQFGRRLTAQHWLRQSPGEATREREDS